MIRSATPASSWCAVNAPAWWSIASTSVVLPWSTCATIATFLRSERVEGMAVRRRFRRRGLTPQPIERSGPAPHRRRPYELASKLGSAPALRLRRIGESSLGSGDAALHPVGRQADAVLTLAVAQRHERLHRGGHRRSEPDPVAQAVLAGAVRVVVGTLGALGERGELGG